MSNSFRNSKEPLSDQINNDSEGGLDELQNLIVGRTNQRVDRIEYQLDDPELRANEISRVLPRAVSLSSVRGNELATALQPLTEKAIRASIKKDRKIFVDVLFPVIGPAIRKAIAATVQGLIQNFNQILEHSFSIKGLRWRLEALRTQRPFAEVVLLNTLVYQVEQVFLIHRKTGLLINHVVAKTAVAQNPDIVSGMLTAIKDFVQDSFGANQEDTLDTFQVGDRKVWIEHGAFAMLALVISGNPSVHLKEMMRDTLDEIHVRKYEVLKVFSGDTQPFEESQDDLKGLLQVQFKSNDKSRSFGAWIVLGIIFLLMAWGLFNWGMQNLRWSRFVDKLHAQPGIVVTEVKQQDGKHHVFGLKDPFAPKSEQFLEGIRISPKSVVFHWEPYQSSFPEYAQKRIKRLVNPPASVNLVLDNGTLKASGAALRRWIADARRMTRIAPWIDGYDDGNVIDIETHLQKPESVTLSITGKILSASGSAPRQWMDEARTAAKSLPGISAYNDERLIDTNQQGWRSLTKAINSTVFYFESGRNVLMPGQQLKLQQFVQTVKRLISLATQLNRPARIDIIGHADRTGTEDYNMSISRSRARIFSDFLTDRGVDGSHISIRAVGSRQPSHLGLDDHTRAFNRRVVFSVRPTTR